MKTVVVQAQQKWECQQQTRHSETTLADACRDAGQEGWELVSVVQHRDMKGLIAWTAFLKRPASGVAKAGGEGAAVRTGQAAVASPAEGQVTSPPGFDLEGDTFDVKKE
jgi:hypothetical protein